MAAQQGRRTGYPRGEVIDLHDTFEKLRRRHLRLTRDVYGKAAQADQLGKRSHGRVTIAAARERVAYHSAWSRWSESYDGVASAADRLIHARPRSLAELLLVFHALEWTLLADDVIVDRGAERQLRNFGRRLRKLAAGRS